jgi:hypothetical protein
MFKIAATIALVLICAGVLNRRKRTIHVPLMLSALTIDIVMLLIIEFSRSAIETAVHTPLPTILLIHIIFSVLLVCAYLYMLFFGLKLLIKNQGRTMHYTGAYVFVFFRLANYITSYFIPLSGENL